MFDVAGVLVLVVLVALLVFLITRIWKLRIAFLKWVLTILAGLVTLIPIALLVLALLGFSKLNQHYDNPVAAVKVAGTPAQIARGERLAHACMSCHSPGDALPLSGSDFVTKFSFLPVGTFYAPNLTPSGNIQDWSDGEVIRAIREGLHKNGRSLLIMPSNSFRNMSDEDVQAVVAYLRSQPPTGGPTPNNHWGVLGAIFLSLSDVRTAQQPVGHVTAPPAGTPEYGKYLVDVIGCRSCHGDQLQGKLDNGQPGPPPGPNLTRMVPRWTEDQFMKFFNTGKIPGGGFVPELTLASGFTSPKMPWKMVRAAATDDELKAIYLYLHSLQPLPNPTK